MAAEHGLRHVGRARSVKNSVTSSAIAGHRQVGQLGSALLLVEDLGLGRAAVDDEGAAEGRRRSWRPASPTMSRLTSTPWPCFMAKLREVAALWAMIRMKQENAIAEHVARFDQVDALRQPDRREPALHRADDGDAVARGVGGRRHDDQQHDGDDRPGNLGQEPLEADDDRRAWRPRTRTVVQLMSPSDVDPGPTAAAASCRCPSGCPSMSGIWPVSTWTPTPVRNPISTEADRKSPRNPSRNTRAMSSRTPQISGDEAACRRATPASPGSPRRSTAAPRPAARIAAVAESAPTTSSREAPSRAKIIVGKMTVYRPVTTGVCGDRGVAHAPRGSQPRTASRRPRCP